MSQISPPIRILLVGAVVLAAAWVLVLKPKNDTSAPAPVAAVTATPTGVARNPNGPTANTSLGRAVQKAEGASQTSDQTNAAISAASSGDDSAAAPATTSAPSTAAPAATATATQHKSFAQIEAENKAAQKAVVNGEDPTAKAVDGIPQWVNAALGNHVIAILFWDKSASDDRATHDAFKAAFKPKGVVEARSVSINKVADYGKITRGVDVSQSPTIVFVDTHKDATALSGYANVDSINQAIIDARLATNNPAEDSDVGRQMVAACNHYQSTATISTGDTTPSKEYKTELAGVSHALSTTLKAAPPVIPSGAYAAQVKMLHKLVQSEQGVVTKIKATALGGKAVDGTKIRKAQASNDKFEQKASLQLNEIGVNGCQ